MGIAAARWRYVTTVFSASLSSGITVARLFAVLKIEVGVRKQMLRPCVLEPAPKHTLDVVRALAHEQEPGALTS